MPSTAATSRNGVNSIVAKSQTERMACRSALMDDLLCQKGIRRYGLFGVTVEGRLLPDGSESASGFVIDEGGRVFSFWLGWDERQQRVAFTRWSEVRPESDWKEDTECREACRAAGLV
jgi:hypothetical protein